MSLHISGKGASEICLPRRFPENHLFSETSLLNVSSGSGAGQAASHGVQTQRSGQDIVLIVVVAVAHLTCCVQTGDNLAGVIEYAAFGIGQDTALRTKGGGIELHCVVRRLHPKRLHQ